jgi:LysM repeat protein
MATKLPSSLSPRMIAPAALVLFAVVLLIVIAASLGGGSSGADKRDAVTQQSRETRTRPRTERGATGTEAGRRTYVVKPGDTLGKIAAQTEVPIDRLIAINPSVDPHALVTGQRIKLRE